MTAVPVLWVSWHDDILARGYADQCLLEAAMARELGRPAEPLAFEHREVRGDFPDVEGAIVIVPARHHASDEDVDRLVAALDDLCWSLVILTGDEEWVFPVDRIEETSTRYVWVMAPEQEHAGLSYFIPGGWYHDTRENLQAAAREARKRPLDWMFSGQVTNERRRECVSALELFEDAHYLQATAGFMQGLEPEEYSRLMASAKIVPCPSGPQQLDTARPLHALEAGCLPVVDLVRPANKRGQFDQWRLMFGEDCPLIGVYDWALFHRVLERELQQWPHNANRTYAWWQRWKRQTVHRLDDDVRAVADLPRTSTAPDDLITVIIPTSPIPSHPSLDIIEETLESVREQLPHAEIIIACDGVRIEQKERAADYLEYVRELLWRCNFEWHNVTPIVLDEWGHQANCCRAALELVETPQVLFVEHDTPLVGAIDWDGICRVVASGQANAVRLHPETTILPDWEHLMLDHETVDVRGVPLRRTVQWWQRPHVASTRFYREQVMPIFAEKSRTFIEDVLYGVVTNDYIARGEPAWWDWRLWVYTPDDDMKRSRHTDGRAGERKYDMWQ